MTKARAQDEPARAALRRIATDLKDGTPRLWSIVVTVYGDAILPRGGELWLGTLLSIFEELGVEAGAVRTSMSRLAADGLLERRKVGRNSFYRLSAKGADMFRHAAAHIYRRRAPPWAGAFDLVVAGVDPGDRDAVRDALSGSGFGGLAPGVWIGPPGSANLAPSRAALTLSAGTDQKTAAQLAAQVWPLERMAESYRRFLVLFGAMAATDVAALSGREAFAARVLLVHAYRRIILRDPILPDAILPAGWPGAEARALCATLYEALLPPSERWLDANGQREAGRLPPAGPELVRRFRD